MFFVCVDILMRKKTITNNNNNAFYLKAPFKALKDTAHNNKVQQETAQVQDNLSDIHILKERKNE